MILIVGASYSAINNYMSDQELKNLVQIVEAAGREELKQEPVSYSATGLSPVISSAAFKNHYDVLYRGYVDRYNKGQGDSTFNRDGADLHRIFFTSLNNPRTNNRPRGASESLINRKFGSFEKFREEFTEAALKLQGSGWVYLSRSGEIKTITNHQSRTDIALLLDMWEHAYNHDYAADKRRYIKNFWRIVDWDRVNIRIYAGK